MREVTRLTVAVKSHILKIHSSPEVERIRDTQVVVTAPDSVKLYSWMPYVFSDITLVRSSLRGRVVNQCQDRFQEEKERA